VALVRSAHPTMNANNVINRVLATATPLTEDIPDSLYGYGLVNAYDAVVADVPLVAANPLGSLEDWVVLHRKQDGAPTVVPLGASQAGVEKTPATPRLSLVADTRRTVLPYVVTGGFALALLVVVASGGILVFARRRKR